MRKSSRSGLFAATVSALDFEDLDFFIAVTLKHCPRNLWGKKSLRFVAVRFFGLLEQTVLAQLLVRQDGLPDELRSPFSFFRFLEIERGELCLIDFGEMVAQMIE